MPANPLETFATGSRDSLPVALLTLDADLSRAVQDRLGLHGLLDPPADGFPGPVTQWALRAFCVAAGLAFEGALTRDAAAALLRPDPLLPLSRGDDLAGLVVAGLTRRGHWVCRHPDCVTIVYVEGMAPSGMPCPVEPDRFCDTRLLVRIDAGGRPGLEGAWQATTRSGRPAVEAPAEPVGAPRIERGQHKAWVMGRTAIGTGQEQEALVQVAPLPVSRDGGRDFHRDGDRRERGLYVIDQHGGQDAPPDRIGGAGAGCLVGRVQDEHHEFMRLLRSDARWRANHAYRFMSSVVGLDDLHGGSATDPR